MLPNSLVFQRIDLGRVFRFGSLIYLLQAIWVARDIFFPPAFLTVPIMTN